MGVEARSAAPVRREGAGGARGQRSAELITACLLLAFLLAAAWFVRRNYLQR
jgi:hypothetical protein